MVSTSSPVAEGLVQRKDAYLDLVAAQRQFGLLSE
jgi:hypothetical protein